MALAHRTHNLDAALGILDRSMRVSLMHGGLILKQRMQERAPELTGRMVRSVYVSEVRHTEEGYAVRAGPTPDYSIYTEEEPWIIGKRPGPISQAKGATIPWMKPAAEDVRDEVIATLRDGLQATVHELQLRYKGMRL